MPNQKRDGTAGKKFLELLKSKTDTGLTVAESGIPSSTFRSKISVLRSKGYLIDYTKDDTYPNGNYFFKGEGSCSICKSRSKEIKVYGHRSSPKNTPKIKNTQQNTAKITNKTLNPLLTHLTQAQKATTPDPHRKAVVPAEGTLARQILDVLKLYANTGLPILSSGLTLEGGKIISKARLIYFVTKLRGLGYRIDSEKNKYYYKGEEDYSICTRNNKKFRIYGMGSKNRAVPEISNSQENCGKRKRKYHKRYFRPDWAVNPPKDGKIFIIQEDLLQDAIKRSPKILVNAMKITVKKVEAMNAAYRIFTEVDTKLEKLLKE